MFKNLWRIIIPIFVMLLLGVMTLYAGFITIDTDDGVVDDNWPVDPFITDPTGDAVSGHDIVSAWVGSDDIIPNEYYFRLQREGIEIDDNGHFIAELDCNNNGSFDDDVDKRIIYVASADSLYFIPGQPTTAPTTPTPVYMPDTYGEVTDSGDIEWRVDTEELGSPCRDNIIALRFRTYNTFYAYFPDSTDSRDYIPPTYTSTPTSTATYTQTPTATATGTVTPTPTPTPSVYLFLPIIGLGE